MQHLVSLILENTLETEIKVSYVTGVAFAIGYYLPATKKYTSIPVVAESCKLCEEF